jgi:ABC-type multidrug transport system ATPase subunit
VSGNTTGLSIALEDLSKRFNREWIFRKLSYRFSSGTTYAITGPNGSGKSTLLQVLWGQIPQTSGVIRYVNNGSEISLEHTFRHISIATPYMDLIEEFTLIEMLKFHFQLKNIREGVTIDDLIERMYLKEARDKQLMNFSSGMRQRLKLAIAFYTKADVYFLDEPGTNLDNRAFDWYKREFSGLPKNAMIFVASNDPAEYPDTATVLNIMDYKH